MIEEILNLYNQNGKLFSLTSEEVSFDVLNGKEIVKILRTECSNTLLLIVSNQKLNEVYELIGDTLRKMTLNKLCISFEKLDFDNV